MERGVAASAVWSELQGLLFRSLGLNPRLDWAGLELEAFTWPRGLNGVRGVTC